MSAVIEDNGRWKRPLYTNLNHCQLVFHRFSLLRDKNVLTDSVILSKDGKRFNVHRFVMAGTSDLYFNNLLNDTVTELSLKISSEALQLVIEFCYSGGVELTIDNIEDVLGGATKLQIPSLRQKCSEMCNETLNVNNCIRFLEIADVQQFDAVKENALAMIADVFPNMCRLPEFFNLTDQQIVWLMRLLLNAEDELFCNLLDSLNHIENLIPSLNGVDTRSAIRSAFVAGFLLRNKLSPAISELQPIRDEEDANSKSESGCGLDNISASGGSNYESETEFESDTDFEGADPVQVLCIFKRKTIQFKQLCDVQRKWEKSYGKIELKRSIESFRDAVLIAFRKQVLILHTQNGSPYQAQRLTLEDMSVQNITLPHDCVNLTLFCHMDDELYCFARSDQQQFFRYDSKSNSWSRNNIPNVKVAKDIVGLRGELYFLGCGFNRTLVRSYHLERNEWTERGNLRHEHKVTCFKGIAMNDSIYVVMTRYDSVKIYNGTEFLIQRFDDSIEDWVIVKRIFYSQYVGHFNLAVAENRLYIFYGDGELEMYHKDVDEWEKGPAIEHDVLVVAMCMIVAKPNALVCKKLNRSFRAAAS